MLRRARLCRQLLNSLKREDRRCLHNAIQPIPSAAATGQCSCHCELTAESNEGATSSGCSHSAQAFKRLLPSAPTSGAMWGMIAGWQLGGLATLKSAAAFSTTASPRTNNGEPTDGPFSEEGGSKEGPEDSAGRTAKGSQSHIDDNSSTTLEEAKPPPQNLEELDELLADWCSTFFTGTRPGAQIFASGDE